MIKIRQEKQTERGSNTEKISVLCLKSFKSYNEDTGKNSEVGQCTYSYIRVGINTARNGN
jgi:hypothetical protein